ncbi:M14 family metallopeptidase [Pricia sp. S334]|uniref:M14 family metallopeptidase n=1 Tax=Pricia mediterranea TaxID=3076079 RepID=A0ABU3L1L7_9FLAO|nr:M14 family metallopeptidase [Pricia sp. S334]MDT7827617.1 M14 family metallopeptidase [Pricia sp. S334]
MKRLLLLFIISLSYVSFAQDLKSPAEFLGYELGTQFTRHHEVVDYYEYLAEAASDRVQVQEYGRTNERRPLLLVYLSSQENMADLENIRQAHLENTEGKGNASQAIVWLSYNVHGNESVSTEASMLTAYTLLTDKSDYLENTVVLIDPCINPDGRDRYVNWYHQFKNSPNNVDPNSKEHHEPWLNGRPNHYMFDLNRDWAWLTQVESRQRIKMFNQWLPHVHVDFHEQGVDAPYYFAPAAEPFHEVITDFQRDFQVSIGKNHAKYFDANGWFYFTKEIFDLLYPSYGDTYPTYNGSIGMTYEQGGSGRAGLGILTGIGDTLTLQDRIAHHFTTGLSTVEISSQNAEQLNSEFKKFYRDKDYNYKSYVLNGDVDKIKALTRLLEQHEIEYGWGKNENVRGYDYRTSKNTNSKTTEESLVISTDQKKGTLVKVLFEPDAKLSDSLTYDITAWSLPYAYGLDALASENSVDTDTGRSDTSENRTAASNLSPDAYAYLTDWNSFNDAQFLAALQRHDIRVRHANKPFTMDAVDYGRGSLIITRADNQNNPDFLKKLSQIASNHDVLLTGTNTGFVEGGKDFGSGSVAMVPKNKIALLSGEPTSTLRFGEIWHFFEQQLQYPVTVIDTEYMNGVELSKYDILVLPDGYGYVDFMDADKLESLKEWVGHGGKLIAMGDALEGLTGEKGFALKAKEMEKDSTIDPQIYDDSERERIKQAITGAIFKTKVDTTHPLAFGYDDTYFSLKLGDRAYGYLEGGTVVYLEADSTKPVAGFAGSEAQKKIGETLVFGVESHGDGQVIYMVDNPLFRGFWENGKLFFANALFMVD